MIEFILVGIIAFCCGWVIGVIHGAQYQKIKQMETELIKSKLNKRSFNELVQDEIDKQPISTEGSSMIPGGRR